MNSKPFSAVAVVLSLGLLAAAGCTGQDTVLVGNVHSSTLKVVNRSDFAIEQLYVTQVGSPSWGANLLGGDVLLPGESIVLTGIACDVHDAMLVDEDGVSCELRAIELCFNDATWVITNNTCDVFVHKPAQGDGGT